MTPTWLLNRWASLQYVSLGLARACGWPRIGPAEMEAYHRRCAERAKVEAEAREAVREASLAKALDRDAAEELWGHIMHVAHGDWLDAWFSEESAAESARLSAKAGGWWHRGRFVTSAEWDDIRENGGRDGE